MNLVFYVILDTTGCAFMYHYILSVLCSSSTIKYRGLHPVVMTTCRKLHYHSIRNILPVWAKPLLCVSIINYDYWIHIIYNYLTYISLNYTCC